MGILLYQQLMGNVFGLLVVKGYFFTAALATPVFLSTAGDGPLCFVRAGVRLASGQWLVSEKHALSHGPVQRFFLPKEVCSASTWGPFSCFPLAGLLWDVFLTDFVQLSPPHPLHL